MIVHKQATVESMNSLIRNAPVIVRSRRHCGGCWACDGARPQCLVRRSASGCRHPNWVADADQRLDAFVPITGGSVRDASRGDSLPTAFLLVHGHGASSRHLPDHLWVQGGREVVTSGDRYLAEYGVRHASVVRFVREPQKHFGQDEIPRRFQRCCCRVRCQTRLPFPVGLLRPFRYDHCTRYFSDQKLTCAAECQTQFPGAGLPVKLAIVTANPSFGLSDVNVGWNVPVEVAAKYPMLFPRASDPSVNGGLTDTTS